MVNFRLAMFLPGWGEVGWVGLTLIIIEIELILNKHQDECC